MLYHILESSWERSSRYHTEGSNRVTCWRLLNRVALIVSRCKRVLNHHVRRLKHMHFLFVSYISVKLEKKINKSTKLWSQAVWVQVSIPPLRRTETTDCSLRPDSKAGLLAAPRCSWGLRDYQWEARRASGRRTWAVHVVMKSVGDNTPLSRFPPIPVSRPLL